MWARAIIVGGLALLASAQVVRNAAASAYLERRPALAERVWPSHPQVDLAVAMAEIGRAAAAGETIVPPSALRRTERASARAPLAVEPYLIKGALAQTEGRDALAERLFLEARKRDPRSGAARYFLAEHYLSTGRAAEGLGEISVLARLVPGGAQQLVPGITQYARTPGAAPYLRKLFAANPGIGESALAALASDAANAGIIVQIADTGAPADGPVPAWQGKLLNSLIEHGEYARARNLWSRISGIRAPAQPGLINPGFAELKAPPPFNWTLGSGSFGVAEPGAGGQLNVTFYGRENAEFASQLLLLPPGQYRIAMNASGDAGDDSGLEWSVTCLPGKAKLASLALKGATVSGKRIGGTFTVPSQGCGAQWLKLNGTAHEFAKSEQATLGKLNLSPVGGR